MFGKTGFTKAELLNQLNTTSSGAIRIIKESDDYKLTRIYSVQGFQLSGIGIIIHVTEHYSYHSGKLLFGQSILKIKTCSFMVTLTLMKKIRIEFPGKLVSITITWITLLRIKTNIKRMI
ncbi:MAG TPA: hypothetical protein VGP55_14385 [Chitinophagaceae bacterium]|nr:hypothetical protein [Chitinophagaceae bacterium]